jgi:hypothetical protein
MIFRLTYSRKVIYPDNIKNKCIIIPKKTFWFLFIPIYSRIDKTDKI